MGSKRRILLIDPNESSCEGLASRLRMLGYDVSTTADGAQGAYRALDEPPHAVIADLFMPSISGAQLCRLLGAEAATAEVPVILRGPEAHRNRFWAEQTGALAYVVKGKMGDLVRALQRGMQRVTEDDRLPTTYSTEAGDVRDRVAHYLDAALFASVIAAEVRNLAVCESFETLFDHFAQFVSQVSHYRWLSVVTTKPFRGGVHCRPGIAAQAVAEAREALGVAPQFEFMSIVDDDPADDVDGPPALVRPIVFGEVELGQLALCPAGLTTEQDVELIDILARELGGALRTASLVEEARRLARHDALTGLPNRRAFSETARAEIRRTRRQAKPLSVLLLDIDHFKNINDSHGHAEGDLVLRFVGGLLSDAARGTGNCSRWGGEEFVLLLPNVDGSAALDAAEGLRTRIEALPIQGAKGRRIRVTASIGVTCLSPLDNLERFLERADQAMYEAKETGRNRVCQKAPPITEAGMPPVWSGPPADLSSPPEGASAVPRQVSAASLEKRAENDTSEDVA